MFLTPAFYQVYFKNLTYLMGVCLLTGLQALHRLASFTGDRTATHLENVVIQVRMSAHPHGHTVLPATFEDVL